MGIKAMNLTEKTGLLAKHLAVNLDEDILLITDDGTIIRMAVKDVRETSRATQGVRLMRIAEGAKIVAVARAEQEHEEEELSEEELPVITGDEFSALDFEEEETQSSDEPADDI